VRYEIEHPVANDANLEIWRRYGAQAWPTRVIIDPAGNLVGTALGEGNLEGFINAIRTVVRVFDERGEINRAPLPLQLERLRHDDSPLLYPGKVLADERSGRLFIADSNHNRIIVSSLDGRLIETVGSGLQGDNDGIFSQARFYRPQGLALDPSTSLGASDAQLYVADTENHQIRVVDFQARAVHTVAGTGKQGAWSGDGGDALRIDLNSPWDLALKTGILIVAMAGPHQIWVIDLLHDQAYPYAGTGEEARRDGAVNQATFAQPSGLAVAGNTLYVADAESNTIRAVELPPVNTVTTIAGGDLFEFGDTDGKGDGVRFQHPLGLAAKDGRVFIADTYNHKIKVLEPSSGRVSTLASGFHEPGGLSIAGNTLFVADTNNHAIRTVDLSSKKVSTLVIEGLTPPDTWSYLRRR
jgi:sugar lactone lactonase YvrE